MSLSDLVTAVSLVRQAVNYISKAQSAYDALNGIKASLDKLEQAYNSSSQANTLSSSILQNAIFLTSLGQLVTELEANPEVQSNALAPDLLDALRNFAHMIEELAQANDDAMDYVKKITNPNQLTIKRYMLACNRLQKLKDKLAVIDVKRNRIGQLWPLLARLIEHSPQFPAQADITLVWLDEAQVKDELKLRETLKRGYSLQKYLAKILPRLRNEDARTASLEETVETFNMHLNLAKQYVRTGEFARLRVRIQVLNSIVVDINMITSANPQIDELDPEDRTVSQQTLNHLDSVVKEELRKFAIENPSGEELLKDVDEFLREGHCFLGTEAGDTETKEFQDASFSLQDLASQKQADLDLFVKYVQLAYQDCMMIKQARFLLDSMRGLRTRVVDSLKAEDPSSPIVERIEELFRVAEQANADRFAEMDKHLEELSENSSKVARRGK